METDSVSSKVKLMKILDKIPVKLDSTTILDMLGTNIVETLLDVRESLDNEIERALCIARPIALYETAFVDKVEGDTVVINGVKFTSRVLRINVENKKTVFPYIVTCGKELAQLEPFSDNPSEELFLDSVKNMVVKSTHDFLTNHILGTHKIEQISSMNPGSLKDWPISQHKELFSVFGDYTQAVGVKLSKDFMLIPTKSVSGIFFPTETKFENCQLCPREKCSYRRAMKSPELMKKYGIKVE